MRRVDGLVVGEAGAGPVGDDLLDEEDVGGAAVEGPQDLEAVLVDPDVSVGGVVECVQP